MRSRATPGRTRKKGAIPFAEQLESKDPQVLACRHYGTHAHVAYRIIVHTKTWTEFCWCPRVGCGVETIWSVRIRDGQRTLIGAHRYPPGYGFVGLGRRSPAERAAIHKRYIEWVRDNPALIGAEVLTEAQWREQQKQLA